MDKPKIIYRVGALTPELLIKTAALFLAVSHLTLAVAAVWPNGAGAYAASAHCALLLFFALLFFDHFPVKTGVLVAGADAFIGSLISVAGLLGGDISSVAAAMVFGVALTASLLCLLKLPRHERW